MISPAIDNARCTCHDVRAWNDSGSIFGSIASFGGECGACQARNDAYAYEEWWNSLSDAQRIRIEIEGRWSAAIRRMPYRRPGAPARPEPPF